jgi:type III restriction enzyme
VYFVAETKSSTVEKDRRRDENLKITCGIEHFRLSKDVVFATVTALDDLVV